MSKQELTKHVNTHEMIRRFRAVSLLAGLGCIGVLYLDLGDLSYLDQQKDNTEISAERLSAIQEERSEIDDRIIPLVAGAAVAFASYYVAGGGNKSEKISDTSEIPESAV